VRVSGNWRVFFRFIDGDAYIVGYDDYHWEV
jgi:proteic killer suppression protein